MSVWLDYIPCLVLSCSGLWDQSESEGERERGMAGVNQSDHFRGVVGTDNHEQYSLFL